MTEPVERFTAPDDDLLDKVLASIGNLQLRRVFFDGLQNPHWVAPLARRRVFKAVPRTVVDADGSVRAAPWPEGDYLARMAPRAADDVFAAVEPLEGSEEPAALRIIVRAAGAMSSEQVGRLFPAIARYVDHVQGGWVDPQVLVDVIATLAQGGPANKAKAEQLASSVYRPRSGRGGEDDTLLGRAKPRTALPHFPYHRSMPALRSALRPLGDSRLLRLLVSWLEEYQRLTGSFLVDAGRDTSAITRPSIPPHPQNHGMNRMGDTLIDTVRDEALEQLERRPVSEVIGQLLQSDQPLLQRVALYVLAEAVRRNIDGAIAVATPELSDPRWSEPVFRNEFAHFVRSTIKELPDGGAAWVGWVRAGPYGTEERFARRAERHTDVGRSRADLMVTFEDLWRLDLLAAVGRDHLPAEGADLHDALGQRYGAPEHPEFTTWVSGGGRVEEAPPEAAGLGSLPVESVLDRLTEWEPDPTQSRFDGPSIEGMARELREDIRSRPEDYIELAAEFRSQKPEYVEALLRQLAECPSSVLSAPSSVSALLTALSTLPDLGDVGEAQSWRQVHLSVMRLVSVLAGAEDGAKDRSIWSASVAVAEHLMSSSDPTREYEIQNGSDIDPLTLSMNTVRPSAVALASELLDAIPTLEPLSTHERLHARSRLRDALDEHMGSAADPSVAMAGAYGRSLGRLVGAEPEWLTGKVERLLAQDADGGWTYRDIVLTTALATYHPSRLVLDAVAAPIEDLVARAAHGEEIQLGWRRERSAMQLLGEHLVGLIVRGDLVLSEGIAQRYWASAPVRDRGKVLGHLGWEIGQTPVPASQFLERAQQLVVWRVQTVAGGGEPGELAELTSWAVSGTFPGSWWLPLLEFAASRTVLTDHGLIGEALARDCREDPAAALGVLTQMLAVARDFDRYDLIEHAPDVIAAALDEGDADVVERSHWLMERLGREGQIALDKEVQLRRRTR